MNVFFFNDTATTEIYTLSLHDALPISTLERDGVQEVPLHEELATVRHYVQIMRVRFGDRLTVAEEIDPRARDVLVPPRSEEHTSELQSRQYLVCRLLLEKKKNSTCAHT